MKKDNVLSIIAMCSGLLIILSVFLPYVTLYSTSISLWESVASTRFIYIFLGCLVIGLYLLNIKTKMSYLTVGFAFFDSISTIISMNGFNDFSIGFYLILICSIVICIVTFLYEEKNALAIIPIFEKKEETN